jgi:6-phosphogluconolactonase
MLTLVAGSYAPQDETGLRRYRFDPSTGRLTELSATAGVPYPAFVVRSATGWHYAVSETTGLARQGPGIAPGQTGRPGQVWALRPDGAGLAPSVARACGGELPTHLNLHGSGRWLVVANYGWAPSPGSVAVFPVLDDGSLADLVDVAEHSGGGPVTDRQDCAHVHSTVFDGSGDRLVAADLGADKLIVYHFDARHGRLRQTGSVSTPPGWGPRYMHWADGGRRLLVVGELACEVAVFDHDPARGTLHMAARVSTLDRTPAYGVLAADIHFAPDGRRLYVSNRGQVNSIANFRYERGNLTLLAGTSSGGSWPRHFAVAPDGRSVVVANEHSGTLGVLRVAANGVVGESVSSTPLANASFVEFAQS